MRRVLRSKVSSKNEVVAINTFAVSVIRYPKVVVSCRQENLNETDLGTRKRGVIYPKSNKAIHRQEKRRKRFALH